MKIYQLLPTISFGDAVSNDALALQKVIMKMGYKTEIFAESVDIRLPKGTAKSVKKISKINSEDIIIYHLSTGSKLNYELDKFDCKKIIIYHNVTPPVFFEGYSDKAAKQCEEGLRGVRHIADKADYCLAVSEYNKKDLIEMGYNCKIDVLPILIPFSDYDKKPSQNIISQYSDGYTNILFTGRIAPNKKQEDVVRAFHFYKKHYNSKSRLIFVGSSNGMERYYKKLRSYVNALGTEDVIFPGHIKFNEILAFYKVADVFLCQSEHEGFCVPLVEAMYFDVPIIAYNSSAIGDTLGGSGVILDKKDPIETAGVIDRLVKDSKLRETVVANQRERLNSFAHSVIEEQFEQYLQGFINSTK